MKRTLTLRGKGIKVKIVGEDKAFRNKLRVAMNYIRREYDRINRTEKEK